MSIKHEVDEGESLRIYARMVARRRGSMGTSYCLEHADELERLGRDEDAAVWRRLAVMVEAAVSESSQ